MKIDEEGLKQKIDSFERVEEITDIIILGEEGGVRRITFYEEEEE